MSNMDRSLDEIIAERPQQGSNQNRGRRGPGPSRRRDGVKKSYREDRVDLDLDWVHDKYEDDRDSRPSRAPRRRNDRLSPTSDLSHASTLSKIRVENLHYDITETDLEDLFNRIGPVLSLTLVYDRAGRSEGVAYVTYERLVDAKTAIREFDGANAKGQPIRLIFIPGTGPSRRGGARDASDRAAGRGSLFDRVERPRDSRSLSPGSGSDDGGGRRRRGGAGRKSDVSKPPPDHIDRYVPGQSSRSPIRRGGPRRDDRNRTDPSGHKMVNGRPRKTQEELDQEMDDYFGSAGGDVNVGAGAADTEAIPEEPANVQVAPASAAAAGDDDVDMIE